MLIFSTILSPLVYPIWLYHFFLFNIFKFCFLSYTNNKNTFTVKLTTAYLRKARSNKQAANKIVFTGNSRNYAKVSRSNDGLRKDTGN